MGQNIGGSTAGGGPFSKPDPDFAYKDRRKGRFTSTAGTWILDIAYKDRRKGRFTPTAGTWTLDFSSLCSGRATDVRSSRRATGPEEEGYIVVDAIPMRLSADSLSSPTAWNRACNRLRRRARRHISPLVETIPELPSELPSRRWQKLGKETGELNIGLVNEEEPSTALVLTHFHEDLYQQVYIDRSVNNETCHALLRSLPEEHFL